MVALKTLAPVAQFEPLAVSSCPCCGGRVVIKANKNGNAYFNCNNSDGESGHNCAHREQWGQKVSAELRQMFHDNGGKRSVVKLPLRPGKVVQFNPQAANENRAPVKLAEISTEPQKPAGESRNGLFGG